MTFDECLNFESHVVKIRSKCAGRLNVIKILSHRSWRLSRPTLIAIYNSLIGSVLDYSACIYPRLSDRLKETIQAIQNNAVRLIFHRSKLEHKSSEELCVMANLDLVGVRLKETNVRYFEMARKNGNSLISGLVRFYNENCIDRELGVKTLLCPC